MDCSGTNVVEEKVGFFLDLWENYQDEIISCGVNIFWALLIVLLGFLLRLVFKRMIFNAAAKISNADQSVAKICYSIVKIFIRGLVVLIILELFGVNTAGVLTVLGAAGLAVALAMKDSLSNIAAGLMLIVLRPYKTGDYVDCGSVSGTIKEMKLFTTELCTVDGMYILVPNSVIFNAPVKNYSRNPLRRADIPLKIAYGDSLETAVRVMKKLLDEQPEILKDPAPDVLVAELAEDSVNLTLRFWTKNECYWSVYWAVKSQLKPALEAAGLKAPFPQRVITLASPVSGLDGK